MSIENLSPVDETEESLGGIPLKYWRSLDKRELSLKEREELNSEFDTAADPATGMQRRNMLKLMGASFALAGAGVACRRPEAKIMPYTKQAEEVIPGIANYFATSMPGANGALGLLIESHEGRPTKVEGNPDHPSSLGACDSFAQASVLQLYDPDRSRNPTIRGQLAREKASWAAWDAYAASHFSDEQRKDGAGMAFLINFDDSPTLLRLKGELAKRFSKAEWYFHDPMASHGSEKGVEHFFWCQ